MIYEYAIEPEWIIDLAKKENRLYSKMIIENFGLGKPRLLAELPKIKKWRKLLNEARVSADLNNMDETRLTELFRILTVKMIKRDGGYNYDGEVSWLENALRADHIKSFRAIIAMTNPQRKVNVLVGKEMADWPDKYWEAERSRYINRNAVKFAETLAPMLHNSTKFYLIDPYFRADRKEWKDPLKLMIIEFTKDNVRQKDYCVEVHISGSDKRNERPIEEVKNFFKDQRFKGIIPENISLKIKMWRQIPGKERFHDRYLLTDIGGVRSSAGFDDVFGEASTGLDLLSGEAYSKIYRKYIDAPEFELECEFMVC
jgi:hypothetical protein